MHEGIGTPICNLRSISRLDIRQPACDVPEPANWPFISDLVQTLLKSIDIELQRGISVLAVSASLNISQMHTVLFIHRTFDAGGEIDPVVVGIRFAIGDQVRIVGDVAGESLGDVLFKSWPMEVPNVDFQVLLAASQVALELSRQWPAVLTALQDTRRGAR